MTIIEAVARAWLGAMVARPGRPPVYRRGSVLYTHGGVYEAGYEDLVAEDWFAEAPAAAGTGPSGVE